MPRKSLAHKGISTAEKSSPVLESDSTGFVYDRTKPQVPVPFKSSREVAKTRRSGGAASRSASRSAN